MSTKTKNPVKKTWSVPALLRELQQVTRERDERTAIAAFRSSELSQADIRLRDLEKAHAELQKFYAQSQDELHACRERELLRPWWKKLLGLR